MKVDAHLIEKLEILAKLQLEEDEKAKLMVELDKMIGMFDKISEVSTDHVAPLTHMTDTVNIMRTDVSGDEFSLEDALLNAPHTEGRFFAVPKVIE